jgi:Na+-driven multidrug efflux pump
MQPMDKTINNRQFYNRLLQLAAPIAFQSLMLASVAAGDALMLGRIAQEEMTAVSLLHCVPYLS